MSNRYITWQDVADRYPDAAKIGDQPRWDSAFIQPAEAEVDGRLSSLYAVPFVPGSVNAPVAVRDLSIDLAYYRATWRTEGADALLKLIDGRFERILKKQEALVTSAGVVGESAGEAWSSTQDYHSVFGPDDARYWVPSSNALRAAEDARRYG
jgi:hypothetical protein